MKWLNALKSSLGFTWAALCIVIVLGTFIGMPFWSKGLADVTGIKVSPWYVGGEVSRTIDHEGYQTLLRRPVFEGLVGERAEGFVQIDWVPKEGRVLPAVIDEELDLNGDGSPDMALRLDTAGNSARIAGQTPWILGIEKVIVADQERILRVRLRNPRK